MTGQEREKALAMVGKTLRGKYRIDALLGAGGMATVYAATHRNGRRVAIKLLHPELAQREDIRERFVREGHAANMIDHAGVAAIIDDDVTEEGAPFLVLELLAGHSVEEMWESAGHRLPADKVVGIARDVCDVLVVAHERGVVHRDLKPANLFVTTDGRLKVFDFGIASLRDLTSERLTMTGSIFGTPAYLPPEQAAGITSHIDARTDIWAVGAAMFTLLSGEMVHQGETAQHTTILSATTCARSLATARTDLHPAVVAVVDRALQFDRADRFQSAAEMRDALGMALKRMQFDEQVASMDETLSATPASKIRSVLSDSDAHPIMGMAATIAPAMPSMPTIFTPYRPFVPHALIALGVVILALGLGRGGHAHTAEPDMAFSTPAPVVTPVEIPAPALIVAPVPVVTAARVEPAPIAAVSAPKIPMRLPPARAARRTPDCATPFAIENGKTRWKSECL